MPTSPTLPQESEAVSCLRLTAKDASAFALFANLAEKLLGADELKDDILSLADRLNTALTSAASVELALPIKTWHARVDVSGWVPLPDVEAATASEAIDLAMADDGIDVAAHGPEARRFNLRAGLVRVSDGDFPETEEW